MDPGPRRNCVTQNAKSFVERKIFCFCVVGGPLGPGSIDRRGRPRLIGFSADETSFCVGGGPLVLNRYMTMDAKGISVLCRRRTGGDPGPPTTQKPKADKSSCQIRVRVHRLQGPSWTMLRKKLFAFCVVGGPVGGPDGPDQSLIMKRSRSILADEKASAVSSLISTLNANKHFRSSAQ